MRVLDLIKAHEQEIKNKYSVTKIGVFGSYARGEEKESSDVDVLVEFNEATYHNFIELIFSWKNYWIKKLIWLQLEV
jgi:predicted nucleotidyltransferase